MLSAAAAAGWWSRGWSGAPTWTGSRSARRERAPRRADRGGRRRVRAGHAGPPRRLAPPEVRGAAPPGPTRARRRLRRRHRPVPQPARRRRPRRATRSASRWPRCTAPRPPWHDVQLAVRGPAVGDVEAVFRERWDDPTPLTRNPLHRLARPDPPRRRPARPRCRPSCPTRRPRDARRAGPADLPVPRRPATRSPPTASAASRTPTTRRCGGPALIYVEDQYLWSDRGRRAVRPALRAHPTCT